MSTEFIPNIPEQPAEHSYLEEHGLSSADSELRGTIDMSRGRASDIDKLLSLAEDLQQKCEVLQLRLSWYTVSTFCMWVVLLCLGMVIFFPRISPHGVSIAGFLISPPILPFITSLVIVATVAGIHSNVVLRVRLKREGRALNSVLAILQELDADMGARWSPLVRATFRIRMSRLDIGSERRDAEDIKRDVNAPHLVELSGAHRP